MLLKHCATTDRNMDVNQSSNDVICVLKYQQ